MWCRNKDAEHRKDIDDAFDAYRRELEQLHRQRIEVHNAMERVWRRWLWALSILVGVSMWALVFVVYLIVFGG